MKQLFFGLLVLVSAGQVLLGQQGSFGHHRPAHD